MGKRFNTNSVNFNSVRVPLASVTRLAFLLLLSSHYLLCVQAQTNWRATDDSFDKYSSYNHSCLHENNTGEKGTLVNEDGEPLKYCNPIKFLTCSNDTQRCDCLPEHSYDDKKESCFPPEEGSARSEPRVVIENCVSTKECQESVYGGFSRCNYSSGKCECHDMVMNGQREVVKVDGTCHVLFRRGDVCETDAECNATITGDAVCIKQSIHLNSNLGKCDCDGKSFWDNKLQECLRYADKNGLRFTCKSDLQCSHPVALGSLAKCDDTTRKCICHDVNTNGRMPTGFYSGKCYLKLRANETCSNDIECRLGSGEDSACVDNPDDLEAMKQCQCHATHVWGETHDDEKCLVIGKLNSQCTSDNQCQHQNGLGELSKCAKFENNPKEGQCVCWDPVQQRLDTTGFSNGACHYKRKEGERCESTEECVVGWSPNAVCKVHESYNGERVCQCPEGIVCKSGGIGVAIFAPGHLALILISAVLIFGLKTIN